MQQAMLQTTRHGKIIEIFEKKKSAHVRDLALRFQVSEETIRRDLKTLERNGLIKCEYGGACLRPSANSEIPFIEREIKNIEKKSAIARAAIKLLVSDNIIMMDGSTTVYEMVKQLPDIPLSIITNSYKAIGCLSASKNITLISTGGILDKEYLNFIGNDPKSELSRYNADKFFFSCQGIDIKDGLSDSKPEIISIKKDMIQSSHQCILLADSSKFGIHTLYKLHPIRRVDLIITDNGIDQSTLKKLKQINSNIIIAS